MNKENQKYEPVRASGYVKNETLREPHIYLRAVEEGGVRVTVNEESQLDRIETKLERLLSLVEGKELSVIVDSKAIADKMNNSHP